MPVTAVIPGKTIADSSRPAFFRLLPENYYSKNLSFFCKKELELEKMTKLPFRFRLGSLDHVNMLEGKQQAHQPASFRPLPGSRR